MFFAGLKMVWRTPGLQECPPSFCTRRQQIRLYTRSDRQELTPATTLVELAMRRTSKRTLLNLTS